MHIRGIMKNLMYKRSFHLFNNGAVVFLYTAVSAPTLGRVFYIGDFRVGQEEMRAFYRMYLIVMISLFVGSFFVPKK